MGTDLEKSETAYASVIENVAEVATGQSEVEDALYIEVFDEEGDNLGREAEYAHDGVGRSKEEKGALSITTS